MNVSICPLDSRQSREESSSHSAVGTYKTFPYIWNRTISVGANLVAALLTFSGASSVRFYWREVRVGANRGLRLVLANLRGNARRGRRLLHGGRR